MRRAYASDSHIVFSSCYLAHLSRWRRMKAKVFSRSFSVLRAHSHTTMRFQPSAENPRVCSLHAGGEPFCQRQSQCQYSIENTLSSPGARTNSHVISCSRFGFSGCAGLSWTFASVASVNSPETVFFTRTVAGSPRWFLMLNVPLTPSLRQSRPPQRFTPLT